MHRRRPTRARVRGYEGYNTVSPWIISRDTGAVLIVLGAADSLAFGVGVAFLIFGFPLLARLGGTGPLTWASYLGIGWSLVSWWPHVNMHRVNGASFEGLVTIDLIFHLTLIVAAMILAAFFLRVIRSAAPVSRA
jgi:hypothetical protein